MSQTVYHDHGYGSCAECNQVNTFYNLFDAWCHQQNFKNWTSDNDDIDKFIQDAQLSAKYSDEVIEWIPYDRFAKGGFGKVYRAKWIDGCIDKWNNTIQNWDREQSDMFVALKSLNNSKNVTLEFINEITSHHKIGSFVVRFYGITQDPETKNYIMVLDYANN